MNKYVHRNVAVLLMLVAFAIGTIPTAGCAGKADPPTIATAVSNNATIVVQAIDEVQKFIIEQEAAKRIPRNAAVTAMETIRRALEASRAARGHVEKLLLLPSGSADAKPLIGQIQDALSLASSEAALALVPIGDEAVRQQIGQLLVSVNKAISEVNKMILASAGGA
jgi:hypothetical protein